MSEIENNPHQALIEEKVAEFKELGVGYEDSIEPILDVLPNIDHPELGTYSFEKWLTQTLQDTIDTVSMIVREEEATAYNKIIDTVLEGERQRMRQIVKERITANGTIYDHDADVTYELENILKALTPLNKEE